MWHLSVGSGGGRLEVQGTGPWVTILLSALWESSLRPQDFPKRRLCIRQIVTDPDLSARIIAIRGWEFLEGLDLN